MNTKHISTTYSGGYTLAPGYRAIDIEASGAIYGGLTLTGAHAVKVIDDGNVAGFDNAFGAGGAGLSVTGSAQLTGAGFMRGGAGGYYQDDNLGANGGAGVLLMSGSTLKIKTATIFGGAAGPGHHFAFGGGGGAGVVAMPDSNLRMTATTIVGGGGGLGYFRAGDGGAGLLLNAGASVTATAGTISGGAGWSAEMYAGSGGAGLTLYDAALNMTSETIIGGVGGRGFIYGGLGGNGVELVDATLKMTGDTITGGAGGGGGRGAAQSGNAGGGGNGIYLKDATLTVTDDMITGGAAGAGYGGFNPGHGGAGVLLGAGARLSTTGTITGGEGGQNPYRGSEGGAGVSVSAGASLTVKAGAITGGVGGYSLGSYFSGGEGGAGVVLTDGGRLTTTGGAITGGAGGASHSGVNGRAGDGVDIYGGGTVINGDAANAAAQISGVIGISASVFSTATVTNAATIQGTGGTSVAFANAGDRLIVEERAVFIGTVTGGEGTLELAGGKGTITGLGASGTLSGAAAMTFGGFGAYQFDAGGVWTLTGVNTSAASLINAGSVTVANRATLILQGVADNTGVISLTSTKAANDLIVGAVGVSLNGDGSIILGDDGFDAITGASASATLTNVENTITGAGRIGDAEMALVNEGAGVIVQTGSATLTIDTGTSTIANAGTIEATGAGGLTIVSAVNNSGVLEAAGGDLTLSGAVAGTGMAVINAATLDAGGAFMQNVTFGGRSGELELADATAYSGAISGFSDTGATSLDLRDIGFVGAGEATFSGTMSGGVLSVTDGAHTARITLKGNYVGASFVASSDGHGGTDVIARSATSQTASTHAFVAAMAGFGPPACQVGHAGEARLAREYVLTSPGVRIA
jgi:hypothetical protein